MTQNDDRRPSEDHDGPKGQPRGRHGRFAHDPETAKRDAKCAELKVAGYTYAEISAELGISISTAHDAVTRCMMAARATEDSTELRAVEAERLDALWRRAWKIMMADHVAVSNGRVVHEVVGQEWDEETERYRPVYGPPVLDFMPNLKAIGELRQLQARRSKLMGIDRQIPAGEIVYERDSLNDRRQQIIDQLRARGYTEDDIQEVLRRSREED